MATSTLTRIPKLEKVQALLNERAALMAKVRPYAEKRDLSPDEQAAMDQLVAQVQDLDSRVTMLEEQVSEDEDGTGEEDSGTPPEGQPQPQPQPAENSKKLLAMEKRLKALEAIAQPSAGRRSRPAFPGYAPGFTSDLNDRQAKEDRDLCLRGWGLARSGNLTNRHYAAAERTGFNLNANSMTFNLYSTGELTEYRTSKKAVEKRAMSEGVLLANGSAGGYLVPTGFLAELEKNLAMYANLREVAKVIRTDTGNPIQVPTTDDTNNTGALVSENTSFGSQDVVIGQKTLQAFLFTSLQVNLSIALMQDSAIDMPSTLGDLLGERLGRSQQGYMSTGTGTGQPEGCVTSALAGLQAASPTAIAVDDLTQLLHSLDRAYRDNATWMMNDAILLAVRRLKDTLGRPIFTESYIVGEPDRLYGRPIMVNQGMTNTIAATNKTVLIGDFTKGFFIRDAMEVQVIRMDERYADLGQVAFVALMRTDSRVIQPKAIKYLYH